MNNENYLEVTQQIYEEFEQIKQILIEDEDFLFDDLTEKLQKINVCFGSYPDKLVIALAYYDNNTVMFTKNGLDTKRRTIIHLSKNRCNKRSLQLTAPAQTQN